jgi:predicted PhzF superfamily epimerase YddE/YHI9/protein-tyrosine-phosphatase
MTDATILFVCVHNAGRSQMAAGYARALGGDRIRVLSGGSEPGDRVNPVAVAAMAEEGIDIAAAVPSILDVEDVRAADVVVTMGCGDACPVFPGTRYEDWELTDPAGLPIERVRPIRDEIRHRVEALLADLGGPSARDWPATHPTALSEDGGMSEIVVDVVRVFTDEHGGSGNPLGIVDAAAVAGREQELATALGFSETVIVDAVEDGVATIRIFTPAHELPFAGHPTVGTAWWLAAAGRPVHALRVPAGEVGVRIEGPDTAWITARPEWAPAFGWHELATAAEVDAVDPAVATEGQHYYWAWTDEPAGRLRSRMFAPAMGIVEDEATGAAAVALTGRLRRDLDITQGSGCRIATRWRDGLVELGGRVATDALSTVALP